MSTHDSPAGPAAAAMSRWRHVPASHLGRLLAASLAGAAPGAILGLAMPRGPMTSGQSLTALTVAVGCGALSGRVLRSRWAALLASASLATAFELARLGTPGPTVGAVRLDNAFGIVAFLAGRGFDGLVIIAPMVVAALGGAALARRCRPASTGSPARLSAWLVLRRGTFALACLAVLALVVTLARPASTEPITGAHGRPLPGAIAELAVIPIGGHDQSIMLRGNDVHTPVLLFLEGGPGGTALGSMRCCGQGLEKHFVVATWDQRGTGKSAGALEPVATLTMERAVSDTIEVSEYLRTRFGQSAVYLVGSSWGTVLGVRAVQDRPDLFRAYVGTGQMVDLQETDRRMYAESVAYARRVGDARFAGQLKAIGPPPYTDLLAYPVAIATNPDWDDFSPGADHDARSGYPASLFVSEYTFTEQVRSMAAMIDTFALMYPQLQNIDFRQDVPRLEVPVYVVEGAHEAPGRAVLAKEWFAALSAPRKTITEFERSGHTPQLDEPGRFAAFMANVVLAQTSAR
ncbi:MAG TPA: alpha/beta hydrolase [Dermatophilaceae bacterium]